MTTTDLYSGYSADEKPSSRVLRPPGGGSSNIFGDPEPVAPKRQVQQEIAHQSPAAQNQSPANPTADAKNEYQKNKPKGKVQYNPITGEEYPADYGQQKGEIEEEEQEKDENEETEKDNNESTDNPNGENDSSEKKPAPAPAVQTPPAPVQKVRQPPGGKSSGLW